MPTKLVVFDMAGTTVMDDDAVAIAFQDAFAARGITIFSEDVRPLMGYKKIDAIRTVLGRFNRADDDMLAESIHEEFVANMTEHYRSSPQVAAVEGTEDVLKWLREKGIAVAMNTGFPRSIADAIMQRFQWQGTLVDDYIASDEVQEGRPQPLMIERLMESIGVTDPHEVMKVGDTEADIHEGRNAKCGVVVGVTTGAFSRAELERYSPDHIIDRLEELRGLIL